jgi:hypothetical protein
VTTVTGTGPAEMKALAAKLHGADAELKKNLRRELRQEAAPVVRAVKASILSMPSHAEVIAHMAGAVHHGALRKEIARTVSARTSIRKTGIELNIVSAGTRMPRGKQNLNAATDRAKGWNHPVYGRAEAEIIAHMAAAVQRRGQPMKPGTRSHGRGWTWVHQTGKPGWFEVPISKRAPEFRAAAQRAIDETKRKLA